MLAAKDPSVADGLLLLSYPLHPPRKPQQLRTAHFPLLQTRCLFVHGTRDPFASPEEMRAALELIPAENTILSVEGGGHELATNNNRQELAKMIAEAFLAWVSRAKTRP